MVCFGVDLRNYPAQSTDVESLEENPGVRGQVVGDRRANEKRLSIDGLDTSGAYECRDDNADSCQDEQPNVEVSRS